MNIDAGGFDLYCDIQSDIPGHVVATGPGARLVIGRNVQALPHLHIAVGPGCTVMIGDNCSLAALVIDARNRGTVDIKPGVAFVHTTALNLAEPSTITIGHGSLFATQTSIFTSDYHSILDIDTEERVNRAQDVVIEPEVWFGQGATVLKGARIGYQSIIGFGAVVSGEIPPNCVAAGNPARVVRRGVRWTHALIE